MKKILSIFVLAGGLFAHAQPKDLQITLGASTTQILSSGAHLQCRWFVIQNNAAHSIRVGDSTTTSSKGIVLASGTPGGTFFVGPDQGGTGRDLGYWYINGTSGDVIDIVYDDGQP